MHSQLLSLNRRSWWPWWGSRGTHTPGVFPGPDAAPILGDLLVLESGDVELDCRLLVQVCCCFSESGGCGGFEAMKLGRWI
jgi:hypothetical protein